MNVLEQFLASRDAGRVLDVATGDGEFIEVLIAHLRSFVRITGIDIDENLLSDARRNLSSRDIRFRRADALALPFRSGTFDTVTISNALHHIPDPATALHQICRVLKIGGVVIIQEMVSDGLTAAQQIVSDLHQIKAQVDEMLGIPHRATYTRRQIMDVVEPSDLEITLVGEYQEEMDNPLDRKRIEGSLEFAFSYLEHIVGVPDEYGRLRRDLLRVKEQAFRTGFEMPPEYVITAVVNRRSTDESVYST
jgi:SAM-dependent methyltransferase